MSVHTVTTKSVTLTLSEETANKLRKELGAINSRNTAALEVSEALDRVGINYPWSFRLRSGYAY